MDRKIKILKDQDREKVLPNHLKVSVSRMKSVEETLSINEVKARIVLEEKELVNLNNEIEAGKARIVELNELLSDIEKVVTS